MQEQENIRFILNSRTFEVPMRYNLLGSINQEIVRSLFRDHQYEIQSQVSREVFQAFISYWETGILPENEINESNIDEFNLLCQEIQNDAFTQFVNNKREHLDQNLVNIQRLRNAEGDNKSHIEDLIAQNLDEYITRYGETLISLPIQTLHNIFEHPHRHLTEQNCAYKLITDHYRSTNDMNILILLPCLQFLELNRENQRDSISSSAMRHNQHPSVDILNLIDKIESQQKIINDMREINNLLLINQEYHSQDYFMKNKSSIECAIQNINPKELCTICLPRFKHQNGIEFQLNPRNFTAEIISSYDASGNVIIPTFIEYQYQNYTIKSIGQYGLCGKIQAISFSENSKVQSICKRAFFNSNARVEIPASVSELQDGWCEKLSAQTRIIISPNNPHFQLVDDKFIVGKSNQNSEEYDVLYFARRDITRATIPDNIKEIAPYCFENCQALEQIEFSPNSQLIKIGAHSFDHSNITRIIIPKHTKIIEDFAFYECNQLQIIEFAPDSELHLIKCAAFSFTPITRIMIPPHVTEIERSAFNSCSNLTSVEFLPNSELRSIGRAFGKCPIESITIPASVSELQDGWCEELSAQTRIIISPNNPHFQLVDDKFIVGKSNQNSEEYDVLYFARRDITRATIPDNIKELAACCFCECTSLEQVEFSSNSKLTKIGIASFALSSINRITIPKHVKEIGDSAFFACEHLETVEFASDSELHSIGENAFNGTFLRRIAIPPYVKQIKEGTFSMSALETIDFSLNSELRSIAKYAFYGSSLGSICIPANVSELEDQWCDNIGYLNNFSVSPNNPHFRCIDDKFIVGKSNQDSDEYDILYFARRDLTTVTIPDYIRIIAPYCFEHCKVLEQVNFSQNSKLIKIGNNAFSGTSIRKFRIPIHVRELGSNVFQFCRNINSVTITSDCELNYIQRDTFSCTSLEQIRTIDDLKKLNR